MLSESDLIKGCKKGNIKSQQALYDRFAGRMFAVCQRYIVGQQEAEDVLQEAFIKVFEKIDTFRAEASLGSWIKRIVINSALNHQRSKLYMYPMVDVENVMHMAMPEHTLSSYHLQDLLTLVHNLPEGCRVIFNLFAIEGYSHKEISDMLNVSEGTSKSQYFRAKKLLQEQLTIREERSNYGQGR
jgi:RNA polymerase sigma-70 factor (ECF subfamily)